MIAAVYCRVSTEEQAREGLSLDIQERRCCEAAERDGAERVEVFRDEGHSGRSLDRPAVQDLLSRLDEFDAIYCVDQGRLSRNPADMERLYEQLDERGVTLLPLASPLSLDSPDGVMVSRIQAAVDKRRIDEDREKTMAALLERAVEGHHHGRCPLGYRRRRDERGAIISDAPLLVVPEEAEIVRRVFDEYATGRSIIGIARLLNREGIPGKVRRNRTWGSTGVMGILDNPVYIGMVRFRDQLYDADHEPIISERTWRRVRTRRELEGRTIPQARRTLSPLFRCGFCGGGVHQITTGSGWRAYRCADRYKMQPEDRHENNQKSALAVDAVVWAWTREVLGLDEWTVAAQQHAAHEADNARNVEEELAEVERQIAYNLAAARSGGLPVDMLGEQQQPLIVRRDELRHRLESTPIDVLVPDEVRELLGEGDNPVDLIQATERPGLQRQFLMRVFAVIDLFPEGLVFHHRLPDVPSRGVAFPTWHGRQGWSEVDLTPWKPT